MNIECDIVVLGAGAAGSAAAISASLKGFAVTLLEQAVFPRPRPGESLHPGMESLLAQLGIAIGARGWERYAGQEVRWGERHEFVTFGGLPENPWQGFQAERAELDTLLLERAKQLGVHVLQPCRAHRPLVEAGRVTGVLTSAGEIRSQWVIDAGGGRHWLAHHLGAKILRCSPRLLVEYGYCVGQQASCDAFPILTGDRQGWVWLSRVKPEFYHWCRLRLPACSVASSPVPVEFRHLTPVGRTRKSDVTWRIASATAGAGYFLAGDAAAVLDPLSSHGVLKGILSGMQVVHLLARWQSGNGSESQTALAYTDWLLQMFQHDVVHLTRLYHQLDPDFLAAGNDRG